MQDFRAFGHHAGNTYSCLCRRGPACIFRNPESFGLFNLQTGHEPVKLLPGKGLHLIRVSRPSETALGFHPFVKKQEPIVFP